MADDPKKKRTDARSARDHQREMQIREFLGLCRPGIPRDQPSDEATLTRLAKAICSYCRTEPDGSIPPFGAIFDETYDSLGLDDEARAEAMASVTIQFERRRPGLPKAATYVDFVKIIAMQSALPVIRAKSEGFFFRKHTPLAEIENLSDVVEVKILKSQEGGKGHHGNAGAFVTKIRKRVLIDFWRKQKCREKLRRISIDPQALERDDAARRRIWFSLIESLTPEQRAVIEKIRWEGKIKDAAKALGMSVKELRALLQEIELP